MLGRCVGDRDTDVQGAVSSMGESLVDRERQGRKEGEGEGGGRGG